jgi:hypothetical protein
MSVSPPTPAQLSTLPDDVLRALADFMPLSGLLLLVQSSRWLQSVLRRQLSRRLDDLFSINTQPTPSTDGPGFYFPISIPHDDLKRIIRSSFREANMCPTNSYIFIEAHLGYDEQLGLNYHFYVQGTKHGGIWDGHTPCQLISLYSSLRRFMGWLHRRHDQLSKTQEASP